MLFDWIFLLFVIFVMNPFIDARQSDNNNNKHNASEHTRSELNFVSTENNTFQK